LAAEEQIGTLTGTRHVTPISRSSPTTRTTGWRAVEAQELLDRFQ
jgi:hypothetical protein